MHAEVLEWVRRFAPAGHVSVLDLGGRNINGSCREAFPDSDYVAVDAIDGKGVDVVADAADYRPAQPVDVVVCTEVFEHAPRWREICRAAYEDLKPGGTFILTCAGPGRPEHSAIDGSWTLRPDEHYANVAAAEVHDALKESGFGGIMTVSTDSHPCDTRAVAIKPKE